MKRAWLVIRLVVETTFGLTYMTGLLLLPSVFRGFFPIVFILGYLGMPRRYHASTVNDPAAWHFDAVGMLAGLLIVTFLFLNGLLWFKDVFEIARKLRASHRES